MQDKKLSELSSLLRTNLDGIDLIPVLDLNETVVNNRNKVLPVEELYQYVRQRFVLGGDGIYLFQGQNTTQNGYFNQISVNTLTGNTINNGSQINVGGDVVFVVAGGIQTGRITGNLNLGTKIDLLESGSIAFIQGNGEIARFTTNQQFVVGSTVSRTIGGIYNGLIALEGASAGSSSLSIISNNITTQGATLILGKTRSTGVGGAAAVQNGDELGAVVFSGTNGTDFINIGARIQAVVDSAPFTNNDSTSLPSRLVFSTAAPGSGTPTERAAIDSTGLLSFNADYDTGLYSSASNTLDIKAGGTRVVSATPTGVSLYGQINLFGFDPYVTVLDSAALTDNRTILFPDVNGTVVVSNSVGTVTSQMIADNTIVNGDISTNANIGVSKLAHGTSNQILQTNAGGTAVSWSSSLIVPTTLTVKGTSTFENIVIAQAGMQSTAFTPTGAAIPAVGLYLPQSNQLGFSTNTNLQFLITSTGQLSACNSGTASSPAWTFNADLNTGFFNPVADTLAFSTGGAEVLRLNALGAVGFGGSNFGTAGSVLQSSGSGAVPVWRTITGAIALDGSGVASLSVGVITDSNISASAAISDSKLATLSSNNKVNISALNISGGTEIGGSLQDTDLLISHDDSANAKRSVLASRISDFVFNKVSGAITINSAGTASLQSSIGLTGVSTAPTASADTNTTQIATTAFVLGQAAATTPLMNGVAAVGLSTRYARADHVHGSDTTKANTNNAALTGIPTAPTAGVDTSTTQIATTAFVINQGYLKSSTASNVYAPLASPAFTGTPTAPTADTSTNTSQLATTAFVKNLVNSTFSGLVVQPSCRLATTTNITLSGTQTIDGISAVASDRILVKDQNTASENGVYVVSAGAWSRATNFDSSGEVLPGSYFYIEDGSNNGGTTWVLSTTGTITVGTTSLLFNKFSSADSINAGDGLSKTGTTINIGTASAARIVINQDTIDLATTGVNAGTYKSVTVDAYGRITAGTNPTTLSGYGINDAAAIDQITYIGTTAVALNRSSAALSLTGIASVVLPGSVSGSITLQATATAGTNTITLPPVTGTVITTADSGTVTSSMIAASAISNSNITSNAAIVFSKLASLTSGQILLGNASNVVTGTAVTGDIAINNTGVTAITAGCIVNDDINASAAIADTKLATISTAGKVSNTATTATTSNTANTIVLRDATGNFSAGTITATVFSGSGSALTSLSASEVTGTIPSNVLGNSSLHVGTTQIGLNRASANQALTGISSVTLPGSSSGSIVLQPVATAGSNIITLPAVTGTVITTADSGSVTGTIIAANTITSSNINPSAAIELTKLQNVTAGQIILGNASNVPTATSVSGDISITNAGVVSISAGVIVDADVNAAAAIAGTKVNPAFGSQNITTTGSVTAGNITSNAVFYVTNGSLSSPSISAVTDTNTGLMWDGSNPDTLSVVCGASRIALFEATQQKLNKNLLITNTDDLSATVSTTLYDSAALDLQGKYFANSTSNNVSWRLINNVTSVSPAANLVFRFVTPTGTTNAATLSSSGTLTATAFSGALTGNASTATALQTARTINGVSFDGTSNITVPSELLGGTVSTTSISKTLANNEFCTVLVSGLTITLPASPAAGSTVGVSIDGVFTDTVIARNNQNIMGLAENMTIDSPYASVMFKYIDATRGWRVI